MKVISEYINNQLADVQHDKVFFNFKKLIIAQTTERVNELVKSGLTDMKAVEAIVIGEHPDVKQEYLDYKSNIESKEHAKQAGKVGTSLAAMGILLAVVLYLAVSFVTKAWAKTWLILVGGIILALCGAMVAGIKKSVSKENPNYIAARFMSAATIMLFCVLAFLVGLIMFSAVKSYIVFIFGVAAVLIADLLIACVAKGKLALVNSVIYIPIISALIYVTLGLFIPSVWATGWMLILLGLVADIALIAANLLKKK